jgi:hypothetical protein
MAVKAQRDYYKLASAGNVLDARVEALAETIPAGSVILDIGCNDGSVSNGLIERGAVSRSYGFDLEDILKYRRPEIVFQTADIKHFDLTQLPDANGALILNVLHHIVAFSVERTKEIINALLKRYEFVIIDMGSFSEAGDWYWRRHFEKYWKSDGEMWDDLFANAAQRFKLLRYPSMGKGFRTLWKLYGSAPTPGSLNIIETFRRPPSARPSTKKLIPVADVGDTEVVSSVEFSLARSSKGDAYWVKRQLGPQRATRADLEFALSLQAVREAQALASQPCPVRVLKPLVREGEGDLVFAFEPDVFGGAIVHFQNWHEFFTPEQTRAAATLGTRRVEIPPEFPRVMIMNACDFQVCAGWDGLLALDFEPNSWLMRVRARGFLADGGEVGKLKEEIKELRRKLRQFER